MKAPELLAPAGSLRHLDVAFAYGADAVYAGLPRYSLRVRNNDFDLATLERGITTAHGQGKKFFLASNVMPHNAKVKTFMADMEPVVALGPDALIMADPGLIMLVRERWPELPIHLSVQANTVNYATVRFWQRQGVQRIILSRELSLEEVAEIRQQCPDMELEVFVHGALCIAYSGRCLLSGYFNHRDPNQGTCTNSCRWDYKVHDTVTDDCGDVRRAEAQKTLLIEESQRPGELMPIEEDEHGTYILNSRDLRAVEHVAELVRIGVDSLKIEGRTKSHYYIARTVQAYRKAVDDAAAGRPFDTTLLAELENLANRGYTDGFYVRHHTQEYQSYMKGASSGERQQFVGEIDGYDSATGLAEIDVKNKIRVGDRLELIAPQGNRKFILEHMESRNGAAMDEAPGGGHRVRIPLPAGDYRYALLAKEL
jgi:putative protease